MLGHRVLLALLCSSAGAQAATFTVSTIDDAGSGSLRDAILTANATAAPPHRIVFGSAFPEQGMIELFASLPAVQVELEIDGGGRFPSIVVFDPGNGFPLLRAQRGLSLRQLALGYGRGDGAGGCLAGEGGSGDALVLDRVVFTGCTTVTAGADPATGGAVSWLSGASVHVMDSAFDGNAAVALGTGAARGGALAVGGPLRVESTTFSANIVNGGIVAGGAVAANLGGSGPIEIHDSVFVENTAEPDAVASPSGIGGALSLDCTACPVSLERNYFGANRSRSAGAVFVRGNGDAASLVMANISFVGNQASGQGGALFTNSARLELRQVTFFDNAAATGGHIYTAQTLVGELSNSVLGPVAEGSDAACSIGAIATIAVGNYRHAADPSCNVAVPGSTPVADLRIVGVDDRQSMPVLVFDRSSPVVDGADPARCLPVDARGTVRPQDGDGDGDARCDAGAYELPHDDRIFGDDFEP